MPETRSPLAPALKGLTGVSALALGTLAYAGLYEMNAFRLRRFDVPVLPAGAAPIRVLHISDLHMTPQAKARQRWVAGLAGLEPDLVVNTGDNISHVEAGAYVLRSLGRLLDVPGVFVWGSNDYFMPTLKNPIRYLTERGKQARPGRRTLPWRDLGQAFTDGGWVELTNTATHLEIRGIRIGLRGTDDAHLNQDRYAEVAGPIDRSSVDLALGVTHAPYRRVIDAMAYDGLDLILAGHTHGGQVCVPFVGALVTNCDLDTARAKGLSQHSAGGHTAWMHVSAGLGTSPYAPVRFACKPEATLLTLTANPAGVPAAMG
ncbi:MAG TPA: metallophosphoesterase [Propionibacteriaceae bacterium]|nr:metallophosphoesterase [Propionibacteriaceae bacterium]